MVRAKPAITDEVGIGSAAELCDGRAGTGQQLRQQHRALRAPPAGVTGRAELMLSGRASIVMPEP
jgi:hypothetical protein